MALSSVSRVALRRAMATQSAASSWTQKTAFNAARTYATAGKDAVSLLMMTDRE